LSRADQASSPTGPWPFITRRRFRTTGKPDRIWRSRNHRKNLIHFGDLMQRHGLLRVVLRSLWAAHRLNWWIGALFCIGAFLFMAGSILALFPALTTRLGIEAATVNMVFFAGSIPFTSAAFLQLYQAANAPPGPGEKAQPARFPGWKPKNIGWLSCALQFGGTLLFNVNTFDAMLPDLDQGQYNLMIWVPDLLGSILFLSSGYLAFIEVGHSYLSWKPTNISWLITFINLLGCIAFMISAIFAFELATPPRINAMDISLAFTLAGAAAFLIGALLMLPEGVDQA